MDSIDAHKQYSTANKKICDRLIQDMPMQFDFINANQELELRYLLYKIL